jgi:hypothetical protein
MNIFFLVLCFIAGFCIDLIIYIFCSTLITTIICKRKGIPISKNIIKNKQASKIDIISITTTGILLIIIELTVKLPGFHLFLFLVSTK